MSWEAFFKSEITQKFGISVIFIAVSYLVWKQMNVHIDARFANQDAQIADMRAENAFYREYMVEEQALREKMFVAIEKHMRELKSTE